MTKKIRIQIRREPRYGRYYVRWKIGWSLFWQYEKEWYFNWYDNTEFFVRTDYETFEIAKCASKLILEEFEDTHKKDNYIRNLCPFYEETVTLGRNP